LVSFDSFLIDSPGGRVAATAELSALRLFDWFLQLLFDFNGGGAGVQGVKMSKSRKFTLNSRKFHWFLAVSVGFQWVLEGKHNKSRKFTQIHENSLGFQWILGGLTHNNRGNSRKITGIHEIGDH